MPKDVYIIADNLISSLGYTTLENFQSLLENKSGIQPFTLHGEEENYLSLINRDKLASYYPFLKELSGFTWLEKYFITSVQAALANSPVDLKQSNTLLLLSTTKGNIDLLEKDITNKKSLLISTLAKKIEAYFQCKNKVQTISIACISGVAAINTATRFLQMDKYDHIVICGGDIINNFTLSGFKAFNAVADTPCKPFDKERIGVSLGEGIGTMVLSTKEQSTIKVLDGGICNDANHISAPSRTGDGVFRAVTNAFQKHNINKENIDFISAHGTATLYNDEMEAQAFARLGLSEVPLNSFKGFFGHTLGGAGIIESIMTVHSMLNNTLIASKGFISKGTEKPLNILLNNKKDKKVMLALKTASGFGGCNAAVLFQKIENNG